MKVDTAGGQVHDVYGKQSKFTSFLGGLGTSYSPTVKLPDERVGTLLVFKSFDRVSYALVVGADNIIRVNDVVHNP